MLKHWTAAVAALALAACAAAPQDDDAPLTAPPASVAAPAPTTAASAPVAAADVAAPAATREEAPDDGSIVVPGTPERPITPPPGDPRSVAERVEDIRAWDQCVSRAQAQFESDPMRPQLDSPEDVCSQSLGMANRNAIPESRRQR